MCMMYMGRREDGGRKRAGGCGYTHCNIQCSSNTGAAVQASRAVPSLLPSPPSETRTKVQGVLLSCHVASGLSDKMKKEKKTQRNKSKIKGRCCGVSHPGVELRGVTHCCSLVAVVAAVSPTLRLLVVLGFLRWRVGGGEGWGDAREA